MSKTLLKMSVGLSGPKYSLSPGDFYPFADYEAQRLVEAGYGEKTTEDEAAAFHAKDPEGAKAREAAAAKKAAEKQAEEEAAQEAAEKDAAEQAAKDAAEKAAADQATKDAAGKSGETPAYADLGAARKAYRTAFGKGPGPSWSIEQIAAKIAAKQAEA